MDFVKNAKVTTLSCWIFYIQPFINVIRH